MKLIVVLHKTSDFRGDHSADVEYAHIFDENTTLKDVINAIKPKFSDSIVIPARKGEPNETKV